MPDDLQKRIDNKLEDNCCDCDESKNPSSGVCPAPLEHMTNWRTEHTRIRLPEDNFAFQVETQKINPNDCNCDPIVESCCYNLNDIPDVVYADFFVDTTLGNAYPCLRPQEGRLGALHSYEMQYVSASGGSNCGTFRVFGRGGIVPFDIFYPTLNPNVISFRQEGPLGAINKQPLKKILERVGGSLAEDKRYVDKFTVELRRDRTFDSHALPQTISAVRHIYDVKETLNGEGYHYREYYYRENCAPTGVVWSRQPPLNLVKDIPPCEYTQLKTIDCVPKMVWSGKCKTPGGRDIQVLYFCDGVDSATGANTFKTMIFHLDTIKNEWGTFKERDFWNIFEKFEPMYDSGDWWSWHEDRDWARFLQYDIWPDEYFLDPFQDYRVMQNYNYLSTIGYREWIAKDDQTWTYYKNLSVACKNYYQEYCSKRGYYVPPQESVQLDAPHQATTVRQVAPFYKLDHQYPYNDDLLIEWDGLKAPCHKNILGECEYESVIDWDWIDDVEELYPTWLPGSAWEDADGFFAQGYNRRIKPRKGPHKYTRKQKWSSTIIWPTNNPNDWKYDSPISWTLATKREPFYNLYYSASKKTKYPLNKRLPNKAPLLLKLFGRWNCPYTTPSRYRGLSLTGKLSFPLYFSSFGSKNTEYANVEAVVYKPYYSPAFYKVQVRYSLKDKPVEEHPSTARLYCPKLPESFLETRLVEDISKPTGYRTEFVKQIADFPNGIYPKHLFVTVEKTLIKASGRNNRRLSYDADMSSGSPKWNTAHIFPSSPIVTDYLDNVGPSGGVPWFEPKTISSKYTDLFYRVGFVGAIGTPQDLTLIYGEWRDPETFKKEYNRQYYTLQANMQYVNTTTFYDDLIVQMKVTSTDPTTPVGTITLSSLQESFTGNPYHRFTNQDLECPYIEFPLVTYKMCLDFGGLYGQDGCVYFPYISPIGEESKIDNDAESPTDVSYLSLAGVDGNLRRDMIPKALITTHSTDWSGDGVLFYEKRGYGDPHKGVYTKAKITISSGVIGGNIFVREETGDLPVNKSSDVNGFDCDQADLQVLFTECQTTYPFAKIPFPYLSPGAEVYGSPGSILYDDHVQGNTPQVIYNARGQTFPMRTLSSYINGSTCDSRMLNAGYLSAWDGRTDIVNNNEATMINFSNGISNGTYSLSNDLYDTFIVQEVEHPWEILPLYDLVTGQGSHFRRKIPNNTYCTDGYKSLGFMQEQLQARIDSYKERFLDTVCAPDRDGPTMPFVNLKTHFEYYPSTQIVSLKFDDQSGHVEIGGDGNPHPYYVDSTVLDRNSPAFFDEVRTLTEFVIPRYQYPHGFYFKCIVTA